jgi:hypothetical protein
VSSKRFFSWRFSKTYLWIQSDVNVNFEVALDASCALWSPCSWHWTFFTLSCTNIIHSLYVIRTFFYLCVFKSGLREQCSIVAQSVYEICVCCGLSLFCGPWYVCACVDFSLRGKRMRWRKSMCLYACSVCVCVWGGRVGREEVSVQCVCVYDGIPLSVFSAWILPFLLFFCYSADKVQCTLLLVVLVNELIRQHDLHFYHFALF